MEDMPVIRFEEVKRRYLLEAETVEALKGISFAIHKGEFVAVMGTSGSGKSTLMHIAGLLDGLSEGSYRLEGLEVSSFSEEQRARIRNERIGFVFQSFNLLPRCTAVENVELPMLYRRPGRPDRRKKALECLDLVNMTHRSDHLPRQLSGGQQQRVAIARALANDPALILADEPTGNLDSKTGAEILSLLKSLNQTGITIVLVTHDDQISKSIERKIILKDGRIMNQE